MKKESNEAFLLRQKSAEVSELREKLDGFIRENEKLCRALAGPPTHPDQLLALEQRKVKALEQIASALSDGYENGEDVFTMLRSIRGNPREG